MHLPKLQGGQVCSEVETLLEGVDPTQMIQLGVRRITGNLEAEHLATTIYFLVEKAPVEGSLGVPTGVGHRGGGGGCGCWSSPFDWVSMGRSAYLCGAYGSNKTVGKCHIIVTDLESNREELSQGVHNYSALQNDRRVFRKIGHFFSIYIVTHKQRFQAQNSTEINVNECAAGRRVVESAGKTVFSVPRPMPGPKTFVYMSQCK